MHQWSLAVEHVRYVGEAVALVVAENRYIAEDAAELVEIEYEPLEAVIDPMAACEKIAPLLHPACKTNEISVRKFHLWRHRRGVRRGRRTVALTVELSAALLHPDGMLRRRRRVPAA